MITITLQSYGMSTTNTTMTTTTTIVSTKNLRICLRISVAVCIDFHPDDPDLILP